VDTLQELSLHMLGAADGEIGALMLLDEIRSQAGLASRTLEEHNKVPCEVPCKRQRMLWWVPSVCPNDNK
jgi:hypothetical protein